MCKKLKNNEIWLEPSNSQNQKSFYNKAKIIRDGNYLFLQSCGTIVCGIIENVVNNSRTFWRLWDGYSLMTMKHVDAFMDVVKWKNEKSRGKEWWLNSEVKEFDDVFCNSIYTINGKLKMETYDYNLDNYSIEQFLRDYELRFDLWQYDEKSRRIIFDEIRNDIKQKRIKDSVCYKSLQVELYKYPNSFNVLRMIKFLEKCA